MSFDTRQTTVSHPEAVTQNDQEYLSQKERDGDAAMLDAMSQFAGFWHSDGRYNAVGDLYRHVLEGREALLGKEHPDTLRSMNNLAFLLRSQEKYDEVE